MTKQMHNKSIDGNKVHDRQVIGFFFFKQKTAYEISACLVGSEMCIRDRTTRVSLCSPGCPGTHSVDQAGLELRDLTVFAS